MVYNFGLLTAPALFGTGTVAMTGDKAKEFGITKVLIVCDKSISNLGYDKKVSDSLAAAGVEAVVFDEAEMDAPQVIVEKGIDIVKLSGINGIVGIGGGSCMDTAKGIALAMGNPEVPFAEFYNMMVPRKPPMTVFLIPTTSGTGSESTTVAVITNKETGAKNGVRVTATLAIIDPGLVLGLPKSITAYTGMDVFAHAAESVTAGRRSAYAEILAVDAIKRAVKWLPAAVEDIYDIVAREQMALASNIAGRAFSNAGTQAGHSTAHSLGANFHIPHGIGCALALPEIMKLSAQALPDKVKIIGEAMGLNMDTIDSDCVGKYVADAIRRLNRQVGIPSLKELGYKKEDIINGGFDYVVKEPLSMLSPVSITEEVAKKILNDVYENYK